MATRSRPAGGCPKQAYATCRPGRHCWATGWRRRSRRRPDRCAVFRQSCNSVDGGWPCLECHRAKGAGPKTLAAVPVQAQQEAAAASTPGPVDSSPAARGAAASAASNAAAEANQTAAQRPAHGTAVKWPVLREGDGGREVRTSTHSHGHVSVQVCPGRWALQHATVDYAPSGAGALAACRAQPPGVFLPGRRAGVVAIWRQHLQRAHYFPGMHLFVVYCGTCGAHAVTTRHARLCEYTCLSLEMLHMPPRTAAASWVRAGLQRPVRERRG